MNVAELFGLLGIETDFQSVAKAMGALSQLTQATEAATNTAQLSAALTHVHGDATKAAALIGVSYNELELKQERAKKQAAAWGKATAAASSLARGAAYALGVAVGAVYSLSKAGQLGDEYTGAASKIRGMTDDVERQKRLQDQLFASAQDTATGYGDVVGLYQQVGKAAQANGRSLEQAAVIVDTINKGIKASGAPAEGANQALRQLAQALGSGKLRGEEFNSVIEQAPFLLDIVGKSLGKTRGDLRKMAEGGQLTAKVVLRAFEQQKGAVDEAFAKRIPQVGDLFVRLRNTISKELAGIFQNPEVANGLVTVFGSLTSVLVGLVRVLGTVGAFMASSPAAFALVVAVVGALTGAFIGLKVAALAAAVAEIAAATPLLGMYVVIGAIVVAVIALAIVFRRQLGGAARWVGERFSDLWSLIKRGAAATWGVLKSAAGFVVEAFNGAYNWLAGKVKWLVDKIETAIAKLREARDFLFGGSVDDVVQFTIDKFEAKYGPMGASAPQSVTAPSAPGGNSVTTVNAPVTINAQTGASADDIGQAAGTAVADAARMAAARKPPPRSR